MRTRNADCLVPSVTPCLPLFYVYLTTHVCTNIASLLTIEREAQWTRLVELQCFRASVVRMTKGFPASVVG